MVLCRSRVGSFFKIQVNDSWCFAIDDLGVSDSIFLGSANSGQTSIKSRDVNCNAEPSLLKSCKGLTM